MRFDAWSVRTYIQYCSLRITIWTELPLLMHSGRDLAIFFDFGFALLLFFDV